MSKAPKWTPATKRVISVSYLIIIGLVIWYFSMVLAPLAIAVIIAYLLNPFVNHLTAHTRFGRKSNVVFVYISFLIILALIPTLAGPLIVRQMTEIDFDLQSLYQQLQQVIDYQQTLFGGIKIDLDELRPQAIENLSQAVSPLAGIAANLAVGIAGGVIWMIFILVVGFYLLLDANRFSSWVDSWIPVIYYEEFSQLGREIDGVWKAYFLGQVMLATIVGIVVAAVMTVLGIRSALLLGLVAAILELIPNWGYSISAYIGVMLVFFQGSTYLPLPNWGLAIVVAVFYFLMWQFDTNYLVPRIIGTRLKLAPAVIIVGIIAGASVGGVLGLLLAAPIIATVRVVGSYLYRRLLDLEPYVLQTSPSLARIMSEETEEAEEAEEANVNL
ncbi:AI-2E family transporter [Anaerolineales bacterium HSG24]|nr:AI-2E family transporter [Anaerolineales bacterium HSG24]